MEINKKLLLFYLALNEQEKIDFKSLIGPKAFDKILSIQNLSEISILLSNSQGFYNNNNNYLFKDNNKNLKNADYDFAIMQVVRHIVESAPSNVELANSIQDILKKSVSRPEKRSKYELQGMLLEALMSAPRKKLIQLRNELAHSNFTDNSFEKDSNLDKWFSIILNDEK